MAEEGPAGPQRSRTSGSHWQPTFTAAWGGGTGPEKNLGWATTVSASGEGEEVPPEEKIPDRMVRETLLRKELKEVRELVVRPKQRWPVSGGSQERNERQGKGSEAEAALGAKASRRLEQSSVAGGGRK